MKIEISKIIKELSGDLIKLSEYIYANPELGHQEYKSSRAHIELLKKYGFSVEEQYMGVETAFKATYKSEKSGPTISYLAEYDALPGIGHGCGHNILGTTSSGAAIVLSKLVYDIGGTVVVFGTPAEETSGEKVTMVNHGAFDNIDVALMAHPAEKHYKSGKSLALEAIEFTYEGKSAHAASSPEKGINALDAAINTFNNINALRQHIQSDAMVHGVIKKGGVAANIVPELAISEFYVRSDSKKYLQELSEKVKNCARGASLAAGTNLTIRNYEASYDDLITNETLSSLYSENLELMGVENIYEPAESYGSLDAGNVSQVCPTIHPYFAITKKQIASHTKEFAEETLTTFAYDEMKKTIGALALTGAAIIKNPKLLEAVKKEFEEHKNTI